MLSIKAKVFEQWVHEETDFRVIILTDQPNNEVDIIVQFCLDAEAGGTLSNYSDTLVDR